MAWTIGEAAKLAKVSVRTLHHYDEIGLLQPSGRSDAGYRLYAPTDLERLHRILLFRELGFSLAEIGRVTAEPEFEPTAALQAQRSLLAEKLRRTETQLAAIDTAIAAQEKGTAMTDQERSEMFGELFDGFDPADYEEEVQQRWGDTEAYRQSAERTKRYTKDDWARMKAEQDVIDDGFVALMDAGVAPDSPEAIDLAEQKRLHMDRWFYDCPVEFYVNMACIWVNDPRFTKNLDKRRGGLAAYSYAAVQALARQQAQQ